MKKNLTLLLAALCAIFMFASCTESSSTPDADSTADTSTTESTQGEDGGEESESTASAATPQALTDAIVNARVDEQNEAFPVMAGAAGETATYLHNPMQAPQESIDSETAALMQITGIDYASCDAYAISVSLMNIHAYATGVFYPTSGSEDAVEASLQSFIAAKQAEFENYLPDQYEIAKNAVLRTAQDGAFILVIDENAETVADEIESSLAG